MPTYTHLVRRDFRGDGSYSFVAGYFGSEDEAIAFVRLCSMNETRDVPCQIEPIGSLAAEVQERDWMDKLADQTIGWSQAS